MGWQVRGAACAAAVACCRCARRCRSAWSAVVASNHRRPPRESVPAAVCSVRPSAPCRPGCPDSHRRIAMHRKIRKAGWPAADAHQTLPHLLCAPVNPDLRHRAKTGTAPAGRLSSAAAPTPVPSTRRRGRRGRHRNRKTHPVRCETAARRGRVWWPCPTWPRPARPRIAPAPPRPYSLPPRSGGRVSGWLAWLATSHTVRGLCGTARFPAS